MTSDPAALHHLLQTSRYDVVRPAAHIERHSNLLGKSSIITTDGIKHKRIRKVMLPAFGFPEVKALAHVFQAKAAKVGLPLYHSKIELIAEAFSQMEGVLEKFRQSGM